LVPPIDVISEFAWMFGGKPEAIAGPMNNREREHEHFVLFVQMDSSLSIMDPDQHFVFVQELVLAVIRR